MVIRNISIIFIGYSQHIVILWICDGIVAKLNTHHQLVLTFANLWNHIGMVNQSTEKKNTRQVQMTIEGHKVTISFAQEANPTLAALVRNTLLDAYIRKNGLCSEEQPA